MKVKVYSEYTEPQEKIFDMHGQPLKDWLTEAAMNFTDKYGYSTKGSWVWKYIGYGIQVYFVPKNKPRHKLVLATITPYYDLSRGEVSKLQHYFHRAFSMPNPDADWKGLYDGVMHKGRQTHDQRTVGSMLDITPLAEALERSALSSGFTRQIGRDLAAQYRFWDALCLWLDVAGSGGFDSTNDYFYLKKTANWYLEEGPGVPKMRKPAQSGKILRAKELIPFGEALMSGEREIQCPHCGMTYEMELDAGETMECWECGEKFKFSPLI